ncbi:MAG: GIY-YIG nuclease family protein [Peptostreptococcaceae bacterium]
MLIDIKEKIKSFPKTPGIYLMKDKDGNIIYVGKSKKLQDRVKSYFVNSSSHSRKTQRLVKGIYDIEIITTDTELDALLLECEMIKKIRPMYNKLMKNHENYSYLKIDRNIEYPYLEVVEEVEEVEDDCLYFGPYTKLNKLEDIKTIINEGYNLRKCKKMTKCFNYDLKKCIGPCRNIITNEEYNEIIEKLISDLRGEGNNILKILKDNMQEEISKLNFEKASQIKNNLDKINSLLNKQETINNSIKNEVILAWIKLNSDDYKVYVIKRGKLIKSEVMKIDIFNTRDKEDYIKKSIAKENNEISINKNIIDKYEIDFINIIYSYIKYNEDIDFILI